MVQDFFARQVEQKGLRANWKQFSLLVVINAFVGGMIGMERTILPQLAQETLGVASKTAILSFITAFGISKAIANYFTGRLANQYGRKKLLLFGWLLAIPVPLLLMNAPSWAWIIMANILLGISQGLTWSSTVVMKIDLAGEKDRGLAMGLNEFAGYLAVGIVAFFTGYLANRYGIRPYPFYLGIFLSLSGLLLTVFWVKDTRSFAEKEQSYNQAEPLKNVFWDTTFYNKTLSSVTQAGLINNLNDGMIWGLLPIVLLTLHFDNEQIGILSAIYPGVWGVAQLFTGKMSDRYAKKRMLFFGMLLQGLAILLLPLSTNFYILALLSVTLGIGTALVYPTFLSTIAEATRPAQRAEAIGSFRLWRDLGYAFGAVISGITADIFGVNYAMGLIGGLTILSALVIKFRMPERSSVLKECIEKDELQRALQSDKKIRIIDVRSPEEFANGHIPHARRLSLSDLADSQFEPDTLFVIACAKGGGRSKVAAERLREMGLKALWLCGGTQKWLTESP